MALKFFLWPYVSRALYGQACHEIQILETNVSVARELHLASDLRYDALLEKYHALRLIGAQPGFLQMPLPAVERDEVLEAIDLQAGSDPSLRRHLLHWSKVKKLEGEAKTAIINRILHWDDEGDDDSGFSMLR